MNKQEIAQKINEIEQAMMAPDFWSDKTKAQTMIATMQELKDAQAGLGAYDKGGAIVTIYAGAGGDDSEDFVRMLFDMYRAWASNHDIVPVLLHEHSNDHNGYRNVTFELDGKDVYKALKFESGVHRLVRISPFNAQSKRQTSFAMVEVIPTLAGQKDDIVIGDDELEISFTKSSGPGGQNVNKRETAVRIKHLPTGISVLVSNDRTQERNREKALILLKAKLAAAQEAQNQEQAESWQVSKTTDNEWGSQIRSYVLHPYKLVKDHRTKAETRNVDEVLQKGEIEPLVSSLRVSHESDD